MAIEIDLQRLKRGWESYRGEVRFLIKSDFEHLHPSAEMMVETAAGIEDALARSGNHAAAEQWIHVKQGWSGVLVGLRSLDDALAWFEGFARGWGSAVDATIVAAPRSSLGLGRLAPTPTAFVALTTGDLDAVPSNDRWALWYVGDTITRFVAQKAQAWAHTAGCRQAISRDATWEMEPSDLDWDLALAQAIDRYTSCLFFCKQSKPIRQRKAQFWTQGETCYQVSDPTLTWQERLDLVRRPLTWSPPHTALGFVRTDQGNAVSWRNDLNPWPHITAIDVRYNMPLLASMVPDANGIQLLTDAHLDRATDLSDWTIQALAGGRHLVEAKDLDAWYAEDHPDPAVVAQARADFGEMIMTPQSIRANTPWSPGRGGPADSPSLS